MIILMSLSDRWKMCIDLKYDYFHNNWVTGALVDKCNQNEQMYNINMPICMYYGITYVIF